MKRYWSRWPNDYGNIRRKCSRESRSWSIPLGPSSIGTRSQRINPWIPADEPATARAAVSKASARGTAPGRAGMGGTGTQSNLAHLAQSALRRNEQVPHRREVNRAVIVMRRKNRIAALLQECSNPLRCVRHFLSPFRTGRIKPRARTSGAS